MTTFDRIMEEADSLYHAQETGFHEGTHALGQLAAGEINPDEAFIRLQGAIEQAKADVERLRQAGAIPFEGEPCHVTKDEFNDYGLEARG